MLLHRADQAFADQRIERQWQALNFTAAPDLDRATGEYARFVELLTSAGAQIEWLPAHADLTLDAIYVRDAAVVSPQGIILSRMGKRAREHEPLMQRRFYESVGVDVLGAIEAPGLLEGGDVVWFDAHTVAVGRGYRTNDEGIAQFRSLVGPDVDVHVVPLPHYRGPVDVFHLMSIISPVDEALAVVYSPLMPVPFREWLLERGMQLVEVPAEEFDGMGANVLAIAPRRCVVVAGAPVTQERLVGAGCEVLAYDGVEISLKGGGGPTCLTRPLLRMA